MAASRSRIHTLLLSCSRCSGLSVGLPAIFKQHSDASNRVWISLSHRCFWTSRQTTCRPCIQHRHQMVPRQRAFLGEIPSYRVHLHHKFHGTGLCWSSGMESSSVPTVQDAYQLVESEMATLCDSIRCELRINQGDLGTIARYYFDGTGKAFRPMVVMLMAKACNYHQQAQQRVLDSQRKIAMITEMLHTATLIHDDVIDASDSRRGKDSVNCLWGQRKAILAGDYILSVVSTILARIRNPEVVSIMSQVVEDLVRGEFMQLGSKEDENERFRHYLDKTFKKTASMLAASCKSVAVLGGCSEAVSHITYQYGRNLGIAFQLVDDLLDFVSSQQQMGKPTAADLKLGLATAPVLFAAQQYPELNPLIMRRFSQEGDVETARHLVAKSDGIEQTKMLASEHTKEAVRLLQHLTSSDFQRALIQLTQKLLTRQK